MKVAERLSSLVTRKDVNSGMGVMFHCSVSVTGTGTGTFTSMVLCRAVGGVVSGAIKIEISVIAAVVLRDLNCVRDASLFNVTY